MDGTIQLLVLAGEYPLREALRQFLEEGSAITVAIRWQRAGGGLEGVSAAGARPERYARRLPVRKAADVVRYLDVEQIDWIEAASQYVRLHAGKEGHLIRESMARLASWLDPERFLRIQRSAIVNLDRVQELRTDSPAHRWAVLQNGKSLPVSPQFWEPLQAALLGFR